MMTVWLCLAQLWGWRGQLEPLSCPAASSKVVCTEPQSLYHRMVVIITHF